MFRNKMRKTNEKRYRLTNRGWIAIYTILLVFGITAGLALPCESEDAHNCTWYGNVQGNGSGESFTDILTMVVYWK